MLLLTKSNLISPFINGISNSFLPSAAVVPFAVRNYAARKGTRERKKKAKVVRTVEKVGFIPHNQRDKEKMLLSRRQRKYDDSMMPVPVDNVYPNKYYRWHIYPFLEAIECHRETHHPEMYNKPNANVHVTIELNMEGEKKTRFVDNFSRIVAIPHTFNHGEERSVIAFAKQPEMQEEAKAAGAQLAGGVELIKDIQNGRISLQDFHHIIAHPNILPELVSIRGLMKRRFPNPKAGTLDGDLAAVVTKFLHGINYSAAKDEYEKDFGIIETIIGTLNMDPKHLEENFAVLVQDVYQMKPKREGTFISRCLLTSPPSREKLKVDYSLYVDSKSGEISDDDDEEDKVQQAA